MNPFNWLPAELAVAIYGYLNYEDILRLCQTHVQLRNLCQDPDFWTSLIYERFPGVRIPPDVNPREYFRSLFLFNVVIDIKDSLEESPRQITFNDLSKDQLSCIVDAFLLTSKTLLEAKTMTITIAQRQYIINADYRFITKTADDINKLRKELNLPINLNISNQIVQFNPLLHGKPVWIVEVQGALGYFSKSRREYFTYFLEVLCWLVDTVNNWVKIYQDYNNNNILVREWLVINGVKCTYHRNKIQLVEKFDFTPTYNSTNTKDPLWNIPF